MISGSSSSSGAPNGLTFLRLPFPSHSFSNSGPFDSFIGETREHLTIIHFSPSWLFTITVTGIYSPTPVGWHLNYYKTEAAPTTYQTGPLYLWPGWLLANFPPKHFFRFAPMQRYPHYHPFPWRWSYGIVTIVGVLAICVFDCTCKIWFATIILVYSFYWRLSWRAGASCGRCF